MKYIVLLCDGMSDHPQEVLGGKTPMQVAKKPNMDKLCAAGETGLMYTGVKELPMGSDVGNMTVLGYDPRKYYTGRSPLEAINLGISLEKNEVAFRGNLVTIKNGVMEDYSGGHLSTEDAKPLIKKLQQSFGSKTLRFAAGTQYRHCVIFKGTGWENAKCTPPHDISGKAIAGYLPKGAKAKELARLMEDSQMMLDGHEVNRERRASGQKPANMIWLWGQGKPPKFPSFKKKYGLDAAVISAVDLIQGLGKATGMDVVKVKGATGWIDTNFKGKADACLKALKKKDFVFLHFEVTDEAGHKGDHETKVKGIEEIDSKVLGPLIEGLEGQEYRLLCLPDHPTPLETRTHAFEPVPYFLYDSAELSDPSGKNFDEENAKQTGKLLIEGWEMMDRFVVS